MARGIRPTPRCPSARAITIRGRGMGARRRRTPPVLPRRTATALHLRLRLRCTLAVFAAQPAALFSRLPTRTLPHDASTATQRPCSAPLRLVLDTPPVPQGALLAPARYGFVPPPVPAPIMQAAAPIIQCAALPLPSLCPLAKCVLV
ncbi:hypothetical protein B0H19DRAFT_1261154 [Mycena capillaripes]|nr:hypothetical protein B0H19DRAFT_1261154 [Mycena capillaripes]